MSRLLTRIGRTLSVWLWGKPHRIPRRTASYIRTVDAWRTIRLGEAESQLDVMHRLRREETRQRPWEGRN